MRKERWWERGGKGGRREYGEKGRGKGFCEGREEREKNEVGAGNEYGGEWEKEK